jgi:crotonobetainyl-CoA:carnitine CoA-transferase CaiB-like acyl-CoA transferase
LSGLSDPTDSKESSVAAPAAGEHFIDQAWQAIVEGDSRVRMSRVSVLGEPATLLPSHLPADEIAIACVVAALGAASSLSASRRRQSQPAPVSIDRRHVAAAVTSERHFRHGDEPAPVGFAPLSRFWMAADGWIRTHANYLWHRDSLLRSLGVDADVADLADAVGAAVGERRAGDLEAAVFDAGGIAAAVRTRSEWLAHPQGQAVASEPLVGCERIGDAAPRARSANPQPASGLRVVDLTRVIAGPVCTRMLGAFGADVLRMDPPSHPDVGQPGTVADTLLAKRSALLDFSSPTGSATLHDLLDAADVLVCGYRPGSLDRFGLGPESIAERHPGLVAVYLDAWGHSGPWASRRGFDSVVQAPTGVSDAESADGGRTPGALPCQLLDHGTGYLAAAAALDGLRRQGENGGTYVRRLSLARTAEWLLESQTHADAAEGVRPVQPADVDPWRNDLDSPSGTVSAIAPPGQIDGTPLTWPSAAAYGLDETRWLS